MDFSPHSSGSANPVVGDRSATDGWSSREVPRLLSSVELLKGGREVFIRHGGEVYRLRHTRNDKLILTK
ncbi:MAG: hemin uptake protein HemP [Lysobacteraceae bacterium]